MANIPVLVDEGFNLPAWLGKNTMKRRKIKLPLDDIPLKKKHSKLMKEKVVSRILVDFENTKYSEITDPLVDKPDEDINYLDYKFTKIELGK